MPRLTNPSGRKKRPILRIVDDTLETLPVPKSFNALTGPVPRGTILAFEAALRQQPNTHTDFSPYLKHHFATGSYGREMLIPRGHCVVGKIHRHDHVNVISQGDILVVTEDGLKRFIAPLTFVSQPGTKRIVYALADTVWTTLHVTDKTDITEIEDEIICVDYDQLDGEVGRLLENKQ